MLTLTCHVFDVSEVFSFRHVTERRGVWDGHIECQYLFMTSYDFKVPLKLVSMRGLFPRESRLGGMRTW